MSAIESRFVDVRHAGGVVEVGVETDDDLFKNCVRIEFPGMGPVLLYPREAYELAHALQAAAAQAKRRARSAEQKDAPVALQRTEGDDQSPASRKDNDQDDSLIG